MCAAKQNSFINEHEGQLPSASNAADYIHRRVNWVAH
jgi:hypothetical protein